MARRARTPKPESGYAYVYYYEFGGPSWASAKDDLWELETITPPTASVYMGTRSIDGTKHVVWLVKGKKGRESYIAQTAVGPRYVP